MPVILRAVGSLTGGVYQGIRSKEVDETVMYALVWTLPFQTLFVKLIGGAKDAGSQLEALKAFSLPFR